MSSTSATSTVAVARPNTVRPSHRPGFTDLLRSEWTKFRSLRSTWWSLAVTVVVSLGISILATSLVTASYHTLDASTLAQFHDDTIGLFLQPGQQFGQLFVVVLGVMLIASEFSTGMIRSTVLAAPRRLSALAAKAVVLSAVVFVLSEAIAWISFFVGSSIAHKYQVVTLSTPGMLRAILGFGVVMVLAGLVALAIGTLVRHTAAAMAIGLGAFLVAPVLVSLIPGSAGEHIDNALPSQAAQIVMDRTVQPGVPYTQLEALGIVVAWAAVMLTLAFVSFKKRDIKA
jgi:ABC-type transport system involved in multi-copper enzyme maturation permease subunit